MKLPVLVLALAALVASSCAELRRTIDQRTSNGPTAQQLWTYRVITQAGREPTWEERQRWDDQLDVALSRYLADHPEVANSYEVSTFRYTRQITVGMTKEQVTLLLGAPETATTDQAEIEKLARKFWPQMKGHVTEAWEYPLGWRLYFSETRLIDITQYLTDKD
jgi:hypothetical protein